MELLKLIKVLMLMSIVDIVMILGNIVVDVFFFVVGNGDFFYMNREEFFLYFV